ATVCNGHAQLCNRGYGNVTFIGAHDSFASSTSILAVGRTQEVDIPAQLSLGVRLLQAQAHENNGELHFCHTNLLRTDLSSKLIFDGGTVSAYLSKVKTFLDANPNEVITFIFTNPDGLSIANMWHPAFVASGILDYVYIPSSTPVKQSSWPTLGSMIDSGKRLVVFMDAAPKDGSSANYILMEFPMIWETPFDSTDASFPCKIDRTNGPLANTDHMYMINHYLDTNVLGVPIPDGPDAPTTNGVKSILTNAYGCAPLAGGRAPNFVLLDWVDKGQPIAAANTLNGVA
ncbi:hypothetical protein JAAARDRAFT_142579, partial [Jaapia argillacea MUCL 33604]